MITILALLAIARSSADFGYSLRHNVYAIESREEGKKTVTVYKEGGFWLGYEGGTLGYSPLPGLLCLVDEKWRNVRLIDTATFEPVAAYSWQKSWSASVAVTGNRDTMYVFDGSCTLWSRRVRDHDWSKVVSVEQMRKKTNLKLVYPAGVSVVLSPDGKNLAFDLFGDKVINEDSGERQLDTWLMSTETLRIRKVGLGSPTGWLNSSTIVTSGAIEPNRSTLWVTRIIDIHRHTDRILSKEGNSFARGGDVFTWFGKNWDVYRIRNKGKTTVRENLGSYRDMDGFALLD